MLIRIKNILLLLLKIYRVSKFVNLLLFIIYSIFVNPLDPFYNIIIYYSSPDLSDLSDIDEEINKKRVVDPGGQFKWKNVLLVAGGIGVTIIGFILYLKYGGSSSSSNVTAQQAINQAPTVPQAINQAPTVVEQVPTGNEILPQVVEQLPAVIEVLPQVLPVLESIPMPWVAAATAAATAAPIIAQEIFNVVQNVPAEVVPEALTLDVIDKDSWQQLTDKLISDLTAADQLEHPVVDNAVQETAVETVQETAVETVQAKERVNEEIAKASEEFISQEDYENAISPNAFSVKQANIITALILSDVQDLHKKGAYTATSSAEMSAELEADLKKGSEIVRSMTAEQRLEWLNYTQQVVFQTFNNMYPFKTPRESYKVIRQIIREVIKLIMQGKL